MTSLNEPQTGAVAHETSAANAAARATHDAAGNTTSAASTENLIEHPRGAEPGKPGRRDAFYFEQKTRLPDAADGKGRGGARYGLSEAKAQGFDEVKSRARGHAGRDESRAA